MGAAYSIDNAPATVAPSLPGGKTGEQVLKALRIMMDPKSALKGTGLEPESDTESDVDHTPVAEGEEEDYPSSSSSSQGVQPGNSASHIALQMDTIPLNEDAQKEQGRGASPRKQEKTQVKKAVCAQRRVDEDPLDVYMMRVAPEGLVRAISSASSVKHEHATGKTGGAFKRNQTSFNQSELVV